MSPYNLISGKAYDYKSRLVFFFAYFDKETLNPNLNFSHGLITCYSKIKKTDENFFFNKLCYCIKST